MTTVLVDNSSSNGDDVRLPSVSTGDDRTSIKGAYVFSCIQTTVRRLV